MFTIAQVKEHLIGMSHGGTLNKVRNQEAMFERAAAAMSLKVKLLEQQRIQPLPQTVHDDVFNYTLPSDYNYPIDLYPQDTRGSLDNAARIFATPFDLRKAIDNKTISIEGSEGDKYMRINWRWRGSKLLNAMDSLTANGTWAVVATASNLELDSIYKKTGAGSIRFDVAASGDGIQTTDMDAVDLTEEDEVADVFQWVYMPSVSTLTSIQAIWGNDVTTKYWTSVAQTTQADGTPFRVGWNLLRFAWSGATETGSVNPATIDSYKLVFNVTAAIQNIRVDNVTVSIGRPFDLKYYSKYLFKSPEGVYLSRPTDDDDYVLCDNDSLPLFLYECLIAMAHQVEGTDSAFDVKFAVDELHSPDRGLYRKYIAEHPSESKKQGGSYGGKPRFQR